VVRAPGILVEHECLLEMLPCGGVVAHHPEKSAEIAQGRGHVRVVGAESAPLDAQCLLQQWARQIQGPQVPVDPGHGRLQPCLDQGPLRQLRVDSLRDHAEDLLRRRVRTLLAAGVQRVEHRDQELDLGVGQPLGPSGAHHPDGGQNETHDQRGEDQDPGGHAEAVATDELPGAVDHARRARPDRLVVKMPLDVLGQLRRRGVATSAVLLEGPHRDPVEVPA
jgi:hypothetical protein